MEAIRKGGSAAINELVQLSFFSEIARSIVAAKNVDQILKRVMDHVGAIFAPVNWSVQIIDRKKKELVFRIVIGEVAGDLTGLRIPLSEGISGWIARTGQPAIVEDVASDARFSGRMDSMSGFDTKSIISVPLNSESRVVGVIELVNKLNGESFTPLELKILSTIADFAAIAIERAFYIQAIKRISRFDSLTKVLNRRSLDSVLRREIERCQRHGSTTSLLMVDIDDFKTINDKLGHDAGDAVLKRCAEILQRNTRKVDYVARYGGDEFAVILPDTTCDDARHARERILADLREECSQSGVVPFRMSIGLHTANAEEVGNILKITDEDMYRQKEKKESIVIEDYLLEQTDDPAYESDRAR